MRRQLRQYKRTEDQVFPTGHYFKGGTYGHTIQLPGPEHRAREPAVHGLHRSQPVSRFAHQRREPAPSLARAVCVSRRSIVIRMVATV